MNNQEMQFAEPEWRPAQQQGVNTNPREQPQWQTMPPPEQERVYTGQDDYADSPAQKIGTNEHRQRRQRRRGPWFWIILAVIVFAIVGGTGQGMFRGFHSVSRLDAPHTFSGFSSLSPTIVINDNAGTIHVTTGTGNTVTVQATETSHGFGGPPSDAISYSQSKDGSTITVNVDNGSNFVNDENVDFNVTVPIDANLHLDTNAGNIDVSGVTGQMSLSSNAGTIEATNDTLKGSSTLKTNAGSVNFSGSVDANGTYRFETNAGSVQVTLPGSTSFHIDATTNAGSINSDFPLNVQHPNPAGGEVHQDVGNSPNVTLILSTNAGSITLDKQ